MPAVSPGVAAAASGISDGPATSARRRAFRGRILDFSANPQSHGEGACRYLADGLLVVAGGRIERVVAADPAALAELGATAELVDLSGRLILPGFVDTHVHYAQTDVIASCGTQLLDWLERYTFPAEQRFADPAHASEAAEFFLDELLRNGTTTALAFATVHPGSATALFTAARARGMRLLAGKVLMDRHAPPALCDTAESGYEDSLALAQAWHGRDRLGYAVTPRFAATSTPGQLRQAARLLDRLPGLRLQSHAAENSDEIAWIDRLFPGHRSYLDVYDRFGLLRPGAIYAHCIHIDDTDRARLAATGTAIAFCPTSNLFLGSGLFDLAAATDAGVRVGLASDVGGGTTFSLLQTLNEAYKVLQLRGQTLSPRMAFYLATLGGATALGLEAQIGRFGPGMEADFVVLDPAATPLLARRTRQATSLDEWLFALLMLGGERAVQATYVLGERADPGARSAPGRGLPPDGAPLAAPVR